MYNVVHYFMHKTCAFGLLLERRFFSLSAAVIPLNSSFSVSVCYKEKKIKKNIYTDTMR